MRFVLTCDCGSQDFMYEEGVGFTCTECLTKYTETEAGSELLGEGGDGNAIYPED